MALSVRELAEKHNISLENLLAGIAREEVVKKVASSGAGSRLWLCTPVNLGIEAYRRGKDLEIKYLYRNITGKSPVEEFLRDLAFALKSPDPAAGETIKTVIESDRSLLARITIEDMYVPIHIIMKESAEELFTPITREAELLRTGEKYTYLHYPSEGRLAEDLHKILKNLELNPNFECFFNAYSEIVETPLEGKLVWSCLNRLCSEDVCDYSMENLTMLSQLSESSYMRQKWSNFAKRQNIESLEWKKVITAISIFLEPVWTSVLSGQPFIGDWMPELGRFL